MIDLYTPDDVKKVRQKLLQEQDNLDPIINQKIETKDAVLDHDHSTQKCRAAIHRQSNAFEGLVANAYKRCLSWLSTESLPNILRNLAVYLEQDYSKNPHHPGWMKRVKTDFNSLKEFQKDYALSELGLSSGDNAAKRKTAFMKVFLTRKHSYAKISSVLAKAKELSRAD